MHKVDRQPKILDKKTIWNEGSQLHGSQRVIHKNSMETFKFHLECYNI